MRVCACGAECRKRSWLRKRKRRTIESACVTKSVIVYAVAKRLGGGGGEKKASAMYWCRSLAAAAAEEEEGKGVIHSFRTSSDSILFYTYNTNEGSGNGAAAPT